MTIFPALPGYLVLTALTLSFQITIAQITPPPPPEISGGAEAAKRFVKTVKEERLKDKTQTQVTTPAPVFDAIDFDENAANAGIYGIPPDPHGAAGPNHLVNVVNYSIEWYTKSGVRLNSQSLQSFFSAATATFDPKVIYDQYAGRFVAVTLEFAGTDDLNDGNDRSIIYVAVSKTSDPTAGWWLDSINSLTVIGKNSWADYPGFAVDEEVVYITCNMFTHDSSLYKGVRLWIIPKGQGTGGIYDGGSLNENIYDPYAAVPAYALSTQPAHTFGTIADGVGTYLMSYGGLSLNSDDYVQSIRINSPLSSPTFTQEFVNLGNIEDETMGIPDAPQMGSDSLIDAGPRLAFNAVWRNGVIALAFNILGSGVNSGETTAHWALINANGVSAPSFAGQGDIGGEDIATDTYTYFPSVALNSNGDLAVGFSASGPNIYAGAYYTGREAADAAGATDPVETLRAGVDWYDRKFGGSVNRWGDYTATIVDPSDDQSFWVYNQYAMTRGTVISDEDGRWGTTWGKFQVGDCPSEITLSGTIAAGTYTATTINATGMINAPSVVTFNAMNVNLNPTFTIKTGATFEIQLDGCP